MDHYLSTSWLKQQRLYGLLIETAKQNDLSLYSLLVRRYTLSIHSHIAYRLYIEFALHRNAKATSIIKSSNNSIGQDDDLSLNHVVWFVEGQCSYIDRLMAGSWFFSYPYYAYQIVSTLNRMDTRPSPTSPVPFSVVINLLTDRLLNIPLPLLISIFATYGMIDQYADRGVTRMMAKLFSADRLEDVYELYDKTERIDSASVCIFEIALENCSVNQLDRLATISSYFTNWRQSLPHIQLEYCSHEDMLEEVLRHSGDTYAYQVIISSVYKIETERLIELSERYCTKKTAQRCKEHLLSKN